MHISLQSISQLWPTFTLLGPVTVLWLFHNKGGSESRLWTGNSDIVSLPGSSGLHTWVRLDWKLIYGLFHLARTQVCCMFHRTITGGSEDSAHETFWKFRFDFSRPISGSVSKHLQTVLLHHVWRPYSARRKYCIVLCLQYASVLKL